MSTASTTTTTEQDAALGEAEKDRAKAILLEIIRLAGGRLEGRTRLSQMFYFAHLIYAKREPDYLSMWPIIRTPQGPGVSQIALLIGELADEGLLISSRTSVGPFHATELRTTQDRIPPQMSLEAIEAIRDAVKFCTGKSAAELSELTREHSHSWKAASDGDELTIYVDLLSEEEYQRRIENVSELSESLRSVWSN